LNARSEWRRSDLRSPLARNSRSKGMKMTFRIAPLVKHDNESGLFERVVFERVVFQIS
jgi:hypothetical protein